MMSCGLFLFKQKDALTDRQDAYPTGQDVYLRLRRAHYIAAHNWPQDFRDRHAAVGVLMIFQN